MIYNCKKHKFYFIYILIIYSTIPALMSQVPSDLMENCNQWKITYPTGDEDKTLCSEPNNEFFHVNETGNAIVFNTPIRNDNGTTPNSDNIRSELRERIEDGSKDIFWTTEGKHILYVKQAITHLPIKKPQIVAAQIHGDKDDGIDDSMVLRLNDSHLFLSFNGGVLRDDITIKTNYILGTIHEVIFEVIDDKHYCYYTEDGNLLEAYNNGNASSYLIKDNGNDYVMDLNYDQSYFKVGNYTQSNPEEEDEFTDNIDNYGEVLVYDFYAEHPTSDIIKVTLSTNEVNIPVANSFQLIATISPSNALNKIVTYSSSDVSVAKISSDGIINAIAVGVATITVTTDDGGFTDTCTVIVTENLNGSNLALNKSIKGTGIHDAENKVQNLVDELNETRWSVSGFPQTATIDLGNEYALEKTELICFSDRAYQYTISTSTTENGIYTQIVDRSDNTTQGTEITPITDTFSNINARYIKITVSGANVYSGSWVSLSEFKIYGTSSLSIKNINQNNEILLFPNPALNTIKIVGFNEFDTFSIYDTMGKLVLKENLNNEFINISSLSSGLYVVKLSNKTKTIYKRIIKK